MIGAICRNLFNIKHITTAHAGDVFTIKNGTRICQAELVPMQRYHMDETKERPKQKTDRVGGFGSTGHK